MAEALTDKAELVKLPGPWRTRAEIETATINWIATGTTKPLHGEINDLPPAEHAATAGTTT